MLDSTLSLSLYLLGLGFLEPSRCSGCLLLSRLHLHVRLLPFSSRLYLLWLLLWVILLVHVVLHVLSFLHVVQVRVVCAYLMLMLMLCLVLVVLLLVRTTVLSRCPSCEVMLH